jgi:PPOX class probable F420-dependent enzyme
MMSTTLERATFPDLRKEQCIALTTFRKTGEAVTTPVWFAESLGTIYVETHADAGKLKRLRHTARVTLAACTYSGKVTGSVSAGSARILTEPQESKEALAALAKKYGFMRNLHHFVRNTRRVLQRKAKADEVFIVIQPIAG